jgi:hypothetical protein
MTKRISGASGNQLIDSLPARERRSVVSRCVAVEVERGHVLAVSGKRYNYAHFPISEALR